MGHTQFMPSTWRRYAIDGDNDGRIDLWGSEADALASGANFLSRMGWVRDLRWGREVLLPDGFDYALAGRSQWLPLSEWAELGVSTAGGQALPRADVEAALLVPAGAEGPAFLVYRNFEVIMGWNRSESYALSVGLLANRIAGAPGLVRPPPNDEALHVDQVRALQQALADRGFDPGPADGIWGPSSRAALTAFETSLDRTADGYPDAGVIALLLGSE
jgi:membrane-bound lytic murein transglycosylase B